MNTIANWIGKTDDLTLEFDASIDNHAPLLEDDVKGIPELTGTDNTQIVCLSTTSDNIRDVLEETWDDTVSKADQTDYLIAACCGTVAGLIDILYVGEFSIDRANEWGKKKVDGFVVKIARLNGFKGKDLDDAIAFLEKNFRMAADGATGDFGFGQHHLRDFSHHFSLGGIACSLFTQFSNGYVIGTDENGILKVVKLDDLTFIGKNFEERVLFGVIRWFFHMISDMAGSSSAIKGGTGIPGPLVSMLKMLSANPCFRNRKIGEKEFYQWVSGLFNGTVFAKRDENGKIIERVRFDLRTEIGILHEIGRQMVPVIINECLVRSAYFVRRLAIALEQTEIHGFSDLKKIDTSELMPFNNRIIRRMVTVSSGVFTAIDTTDALVRALIKNKGINPGFAVDFAVRVNFVGVGRFVIACVADAGDIVSDIKEDYRKHDKNYKEYEKAISDLKCLELDFEQARVLYSLERLIVLDDIFRTKDEEKKLLKQEWVGEWENQILDSMPIVDRNSFFYNEPGITYVIGKMEQGAWLYLVTMESLLFEPYYGVYGVKEKDSRFKNLKCKSKYLKTKYPNLQGVIKTEDIELLEKEYKRANKKITDSTKIVAIGSIGTAALVAATGGLAFAFAPAIAPIIVGDAAAGLYGAALTSFSLAAIGGGSLAAGGLGMAGGTAIITGGGALIGMLGGTSVSAASTVSILCENGFVLSECCRLLVFCRAVLIGKYHDVDAVRAVYASVDNRVKMIDEQIDAMKSDKKSSDDKDAAKKMRIAKKSVKYMKRCCKEIEKLTV